MSIALRSALTREELEKTMKDGKKIVEALKDDEDPKEEKEGPKQAKETTKD